jgi:hypothetical protein
MYSKTLWQRSIVLLLVLPVVLLLQCCKKDKTLFTGQVVDGQSKPLSGVAIQMNGQKAETDNEGKFKIEIDSAAQYSLNARKENYSTYTQLFTNGVKNFKITLYEATVQSVDPTKDIVVTDVKSQNRPGPAASTAAWDAHSIASVPLVYENGKLVDFGFSSPMKEAFNYVRSRTRAGSGITLSIPANSLVRNGQLPSNNVNVSLSTIDIFSAGAMPGDMTVMRRDGSRGGFMISFGAGSIEIYDEKGQYQLTEKSKATLTIPVDTSAMILSKDIPSTVPLFYYDEKTGFWVEDGEANLNETRTAYVAPLRHFSSFNIDIEKTTPSCLQVRHNAIGASTLASYKIEAIVPYNGNVIHQERTILDPGPNPAVWPVGDTNPCLQNANGTSVHMLYNLPENTEVCLIFYEIGAVDTPINIAIATTGATYGATLPTCPTVACDASCVNDCADESCGGYGTCSFVPFQKLTNALLLAKKRISPTEIKFKWILNRPSGAITYNLYETDDLGNVSATLQTIVQTIADDPLTPKEFIYAIPGGATGQHFFKVVATEGANTYESIIVDETY